MTITGESQAGTIINGTGINGVFLINYGVSVSISKLTITNATLKLTGDEHYTSIYNYGNLTVENCTFNNNSANGIGGTTTGSAIHNQALANNNPVICTVTNCNFTSNSYDAISNYAIQHGSSAICTVTNCNFTSNDLAIYNLCESLSSVICTVVESNFTNNIGSYCGGIYNKFEADSGSITCTVMDSVFINNQAIYSGGGAICNSFQGIAPCILTCTVMDSVFINNQATFPGSGGAIMNRGTGSGFVNCTVIESSFSNNQASNGGAILNRAMYSGFVNCTVIESSFSNNQASNGGAILNRAMYSGFVNCTVIESSFSNNQASNGGAISNEGDYSSGGSINCTLTESTFTNNRAGGNGGVIYNILNHSTCPITITANFNRFYNNTATNGNVIYNNGGSVDADNNWWGVNDPNSNWSEYLSGVSTSPSKWAQLGIHAAPDVIGTGETSSVTANLNYNNLGENLLAIYHHSIPSVDALFAVDILGTLSTYSGIIFNGGNLTTTFTAGQMPGTSKVNVTVDNATVTKSITIQRDDVYVATSANGGSDSNNGSSEYPFLTLNKAITEVRTGGRIHIANGEYTGSLNRGLTTTKNITILQDTWISGVGDSVIINAENKDCIIHNGYTLILQNLMMINGNNSGNFGYGGAIQNYGNLTVENCTFSDNTANYGGVIANIFKGEVVCHYTGTTSFTWEYSGAITSTIIGCTFNNNTATYDGGAISNYIYTASTVEASEGANISASLFASIISTINNCTFTNNTAMSGGAISNNCTIYGTAISENGNATAVSKSYINSTITNCTLINNRAVYGGAISDYSSINIKAESTNANTSVVGHSSIYDSITGNTLTGNSAIYGGAISAMQYLSISANWNDNYEPIIDDKVEVNSQVHFNRIVLNTAATGPAIYGSIYPALNATYNWWGTNENPSSFIIGNVDYSPWLFMTINATPQTINNSQTSLVTVSFNNYSSDGSSSSPLDPNLGHIPDGVPVSFRLIGDIRGSLDEPLTVPTSDGTISILFTASKSGIQQINATTDQQNVSVYVTIIPASFVEISKEFMDLPWGNVITSAYYNDRIYAIVKVHNAGPDSTSINVLDLLDGLTWTGNYYVYRAPGSYPNSDSAWVPNDSDYPFNGTDWDVGSLSIMIGSSRWLAVEVRVNRTGTVSNYAETYNQSTSPYQGYANYTAYLTSNIALTIVTVDDVRGNKGDTITLRAVLTDYLGNALAGEIVEFWIDNVKVGQNITDSTGTALFNYVISQTPGNHTLSAVFNETSFYQRSNATGRLYVPTANLYIQITSNNNNPTVGEIFTLRYKLGNYGPDDALNVTITIPLPDGFVISKIDGDGTWTIVGNTIIWNMKNVTVGDPDLYVSGWTRWAGSFLFGASISSDTFNLNSMSVDSFSLNAVPQVNAASVTSNTIGMQTTGAPITGIILAVLLVLGGLVGTHKKQ
nr:hypothetical protein [uncultured Methanobacterium sp.]